MTYEPGQRCLHNNNKLVQNINFGANFDDNHDRVLPRFQYFDTNMFINIENLPYNN